MGERIGNPMTDAEPIIDSTLPDGSRLNVIYSDDVSVKGPSLTIRQGDEVPLTVTQITNWGRFRRNWLRICGSVSKRADGVRRRRDGLRQDDDAELHYVLYPAGFEDLHRGGHG